MAQILNLRASEAKPKSGTPRATSEQTQNLGTHLFRLDEKAKPKLPALMPTPADSKRIFEGCPQVPQGLRVVLHHRSLISEVREAFGAEAVRSLQSGASTLNPHNLGSDLRVLDPDL